MTAVKTVNSGEKKPNPDSNNKPRSGSAPEVRRLNGQNTDRGAEASKELLMFAVSMVLTLLLSLVKTGKSVVLNVMLHKKWASHDKKGRH